MAADVHALTMPKLGLTMKEGSVAHWYAEPGGQVKAGEPVADIESSKITAAYEAPVSGVLRRQTAAKGTVLPVGALIGVVASEDVADAEIDAFVGAFTPLEKA
ncbi:MAG TPA: biotin/lipoyl-containing protein [Candidatus Dormibacteraeota bacterium]|nr:biotin/lipoyl-containing protein [Candidatus Dormibacteraeota bacterium]